MRVYIPATLAMLRNAVDQGAVAPVRGLGFAVTEALRAEYGGADTEDLSTAMHDAALASLRLIAGANADPVRVVIAVDDLGAREQAWAARNGGRAADRDVADVASRDDLDRAAVEIGAPVPWRQVVAVHLDGGDAAAQVAAAADAIAAADLGDDDAEITVGDVEDIDLAWYAPHEVQYLLAELDPPR